MDLTKDSEKLLCLLYKSYLEKVNSGLSKSTANAFGDSHKIHDTLCPDWLFEDVDETCRQLSRAGFLKCFWADGIASETSLSDSGIVYMENRFKNSLLSVADFLSNFL